MMSTLIRRTGAGVGLAALVAAGAAGAQPVPATRPAGGDPETVGDSLYRLRRPADALAMYRRVIGSGPRRYEALCKASRTAVDLAEAEIGRAHV